MTIEESARAASLEIGLNNKLMWTGPIEPDVTRQPDYVFHPTHSMRTEIIARHMAALVADSQQFLKDQLQFTHDRNAELVRTVAQAEKMAAERDSTILSMQATIAGHRDELARAESVRANELRVSHEALDSAGVCAGGSLATRVGLLVKERDEAKKTMRRAMDRALGSQAIAFRSYLDAADARSTDLQALLARAHPLVCKLRCREGRETEHGELCREIAEALEGGGDG